MADSTNSENYSVGISEDYRNLTVPQNEVVLGCVGDAWVRRVHFTAPRYCDGTDLSGYDYTVQFVNEGGVSDVYEVDDATASTDTVTFTWPVSPIACAVVGKTEVSIVASNVDAQTGDVLNRFVTTTYEWTVLPSTEAEGGEAIEAESYVEAMIAAWQADIDAAIAASNRSYQTVADMVADTDLTAGKIVHTLGFYTAGDGGAAWYLISSTGTANDMLLDNGLYAIYKADIIKNVVDDITKDNQNIFVNNTDLTVSQGNDTHVNIVHVKEDYTLTSAIASGICAAYNVNGTQDACAAMALVGSYIRHANEFFYSNDYTGTTYEGTYESPTLVDPKQHMTDSKMPIDCATFSTLIGGGCSYENSIYASGNTRNRLYHEMFNIVGGSTKPYWKYNPKHETFENPNVGYGRVLSDAQAKMFFDAGVLSSINDTTEQLQIGDIIFTGNDSERFMKITHCSVFAGMVDFSTTGMIIAESVSTTTNAIVTRTLQDTNNSEVIRAKISPNYNAGLRLHHYYSPYVFPIYNRNLSTNPVTWNADTGAGDVLPKVIAITSNNSSRRYIHVVATNGLSTIEKDINFVGSRLFFLPYGWGITITSAETATFNIVEQKCGTDKAIIILPRTVS